MVDSIALLGVVNALLLAIAAAAASRRDDRWAWLSALFALLSIIVAAILVSHRTDGLYQRLAVAVEQLAWATGPLLYLYMHRSVGRVVTMRLAAVHLLLPTLVLLLSAALIVAGRAEPLPAELLIAYQLVYTAASATLFLQRADRQDHSAIAFWWPVAVLGTMIAIHLAQLARLSPWGGQARDVVPLIGSIAGVALVLVALLLGQQVARRSARYAKSGLGEQRARQIFDQACAILERDQLFRRWDLSLGDAAAAAGVAPHQLSQALSAAGTSFNELLAGLRIAEAKRLLLDPANAQVAVEPLGMEAGFRSRSSFYQAFRSRTGLSPAEFRRAGGEIMSAPSGPDTQRLA